MQLNLRKISDPRIRANIELMQKRYRGLMDEQSKVFEMSGQHYIHNQRCHGCGLDFEILNALLCPNGYWSFWCNNCKAMRIHER